VTDVRLQTIDFGGDLRHDGALCGEMRPTAARFVGGGCYVNFLKTNKCWRDALFELRLLSMMPTILLSGGFRYRGDLYYEDS
jgi:hypothetical protein